MVEYKYTRHIWTKDNEFLGRAERTLTYMAYSSTEEFSLKTLFNTAAAFYEYDSLGTPQKKFGHLITKLVDRSKEYFNVTDPGMWARVHLPYNTVRDTAATEALARLMFIFTRGLYMHCMEGLNTVSDGSDKRRYVMMEEDPVRMFLHPKAYTMEGISTTVHSSVFEGHSLEFLPWDGTKGVAWLATDFTFELFTLIAKTLKDVLF